MATICGRCGASVSGFNNNCPICGAKLTSKDAELGSFLAFIGSLILWPLLNLPAFFPAFYITKFFDAVIFQDTASPAVRILAILFSVIFLSAVIWCVFSGIAAAIKELSGKAKTIGRLFLWGYILLCYGFLGFSIAQFSEVDFAGQIIIVVLTVLVGGGFSVTKLNE